MKFSVSHILHYSYSAPVHLTPHYLYLTPRISPYQELIVHQLTIWPHPNLLVRNVDAETNIQHIAYINEPSNEFKLTSFIEVESNSFNPFDFVYFPFEAQHLPFAYIEREKILLKPYLNDEGITTLIHQTAREIAANAEWQTGRFLTDVSQYIQRNFRYLTREEGSAYPPEYTLIHRNGSCRDFAVLMIAFCKAIGIAARFVSGYCYGDERHRHDLHAWVEVYLPGGGWRGFDPTEGNSVNETYLALAASAQPDHINPITGSFKSQKGVDSTLTTEIIIKPIS